jgi:hypothetical protein
MQRVGDISQVAGARRCVLADGKAQGIEAVDIRTGGGLSFTVLPGRGMDIAWADYRGVPVAYLSKTGVAGPSYYEPDGVQWLRTFFAGLLTTCGLSNVGGPCAEEEPVVGVQRHGLHGRISNMAADQVGVREEWQGDDFVMTVSGRLREAMLHGENLTLRREITATLGENRFFLHDIVENEGFSVRPLMLLYHCNIGYPVLDQGSRLICASTAIEPLSDLARSELDRCRRMDAPEVGYPERVYFHELGADRDGRTGVALVNDALGLGVYVRFDRRQLPRFTQWKQLSAAEYVVGLEPGNCWPVGRLEQRRRGALEMIEAGQRRTFDLEIGVLDGAAAIAQFARSVGAAEGANGQ